MRSWVWTFDGTYISFEQGADVDASFVVRLRRALLRTLTPLSRTADTRSRYQTVFNVERSGGATAEVTVLLKLDPHERVGNWPASDSFHGGLFEAFDIHTRRQS